MALALVTDADNTLWDTDRVYMEAQLWLLLQLEGNHPVPGDVDERLRYVRRVDESIAKRHHAGLRYPSILLVKALCAVVEGVALKKATNNALHSKSLEPLQEKIANEFDAMLKRIPPLRVGVVPAFEAINSLGLRVLVATEGSADRCQARLAHWGLANKVAHILSATKSKELFLRASKLLGVPASHSFVVGDQLDRDIAFAASAGCKTIYFPGAFKPTWLPTLEEIKPDFVIADYSEVVEIVKMQSAAFVAQGSRNLWT